MGTATTTFGSSRRESHDSSAFYKRFDQVEETKDETVGIPEKIDKIFHSTSEKMSELPDNSVDLMVTSPPYNAGKDYDVNQTFDDYLDFLHRVLSECYRTLKNGGRAAINVANLGRKPYIELTTFVSAICNDIGYFPRAHIVWEKAQGANSSCAWGSFQSASNPVIRDTNEFILIYSKGRYGRQDKGESTISKEHFMRDTLSVWKFPPENATRIGHPAPFPVELPARLIDLYTYRGDLVLDPFCGSGATAVAALTKGRHYVGYETDADYVALAEDRISKI